MEQQKHTQPHVKALEPSTLILSIAMSVISAMICMQIIAKLGFSANTSIIGALLAMSLARIPISAMSKFKSLDRQNLVQTMSSGAGFAASNCGIFAVSIFAAMDKPEYINMMLLGGCAATLISIYFVYSIYDSSLFPASAPWPPGVATAQALFAGDEGGAKARRMFEGIILGIAGSAVKIPAAFIGLPGTATFGLPMAGIAIAFIANIWSMAALAAGLLIRGYLPIITGFDIGKTYIPHGLMVGAGMASLIQIAYVLYKTNKDNSDSVSEDEGVFKVTVTPKETKRALSIGFAVYMASAIGIAVLTGIANQLPASKLLLWVAWAGFSSFVAPILIGLCAMRSGWFPGTAVTIIFLTIGLFLGFNPVSLALLSGFVGCTGPCFADMGFDLKTGWIIRGKSKYLAYEKDGRKQQFISEVIGAVIGFVVVAAFMHVYFRLDLLPPTSRVMAVTAQAAGNQQILMELLKWGVVGMVIQFISGQKTAIGILLATGLLLNAPMYGIGVLLAVVVRLVAGKAFMEIIEAGMIAGDGIYGFIIAVMKAF